MFRPIIVCGFLAVVTDIVQCKLVLPPGMSLHQVMSTWDEAFDQCVSEGAVLASPVNEELLGLMKSVMEVKRFTFHIGTRARYTPGKYVSIEGIPLENMTVAMSDMVQPLDRSDGDCLSMDRERIRAIPCWTELPYLCVRINNETYKLNKTNCGTIEQGYKYEEATSSCYKLHTNKQLWNVAQQTCFSEGAHLVIIENADEANILKNMYQITQDFMLIGLRDVDENGNWRYVNGQPVEELYNNWVTGRKPTSGKYIVGALHSDGRLDDRPVEYKKPFICEKQPNI